MQAELFKIAMFPRLLACYPGGYPHCWDLPRWVSRASICRKNIFRKI
jgi:hypothetical protein